MPITKHGLSLDKQWFWDRLCIRYNVPPKFIPSFCVWKSVLKLEHVLLCPKGGFMSIRHNEFRDFTAELLLECCKDVLHNSLYYNNQQVKLYRCQQFNPVKLVLMLQLKDSGLKDKQHTLMYRCTALQLKVYLAQSLNTAYRLNKQTEKWVYNRGVNSIDQKSFTSVVFMCFIGVTRVFIIL